MGKISADTGLGGAGGLGENSRSEGNGMKSAMKCNGTLQTWRQIFAAKGVQWPEPAVLEADLRLSVHAVVLHDVPSTDSGLRRWTCT